MSHTKRSKTWRTWTFKEEKRLKDMRAQGMTIARCAAALSRSLPSVKCRLQTLDAPKHLPRRMDYLLAITTPGLTNREMAERLGVKRHTVIVMKKRIKRKSN